MITTPPHTPHTHTHTHTLFWVRSTEEHIIKMETVHLVEVVTADCVGNQDIVRWVTLFSQRQVKLKQAQHTVGQQVAYIV